LEKFSVLMSVYAKDSPGHLEESLRSLEGQTRPADEIVLIKDGPLGGELDKVIADFSARLPIKAIQLTENRGLGYALSVGVPECRHERIARMDADDISVADRFQLQMKYLEANPEIDALSGAIMEFDAEPSMCVAQRHLPNDHASLFAFGKKRCPLNHMAVVFRKSSVLAAGNYQTRYRQEDYDLWVRMLVNGAIFHNLDNVLVLVRCGNGMQSRRGGLSYLSHEASLFWHFRSLGYINFSEFLYSIGIRVPVRLFPSEYRSLLYRAFVRKPPTMIKS